MKSLRLIAPMLICLVLLAAVASAQSNAETLLIAVIGADEGVPAQQDNDILRGAALAAEAILDSDDGAVQDQDGERYAFEVVFYAADTASEATDAYEEAVTDGATVVIGPSQSNHIEAIVDRETLSVPVLAPIPDAPADGSVYPLVADESERVRVIADYLQNERFLESYAVVTADSATARDAADTFTATVGEENVALTLIHDADETDFMADAESIRSAGVDALFVWTFDDPGENLLRALDREGYTGTIAYADLDDDFVTSTGVKLTEDLIGVTNWWMTAYDNASQQFVVDYQTTYDALPTPLAAAAYDAVNWVAAAVAAGTADDGIALDATDYRGIQGSYTGGEVSSVLLLQADSEGQLVDLARYADGECRTCADIWSRDISDEAFATTNTITVALLTTTDGPTQVYGEHIQQAVELAVREINQAGGFTGAESTNDGERYTLRLLTYPVTDAEDTAAAFEQASADGADFVLGPDYNAHILPNLLLAEGTETVQFTSATGLTSNLVNVPLSLLQIRANDVTQAAAATDYVLHTLDLTDIATVAVRADYGLDAVEAVHDTITASEDGRLVLSLEHNIEQDDFGELAVLIDDSEAEAVMVWSTQPAAAALLTALDAEGWEGVFVYGYLTETLLAALPTSDSVRVIGPVAWTPAARDWNSQTFVERYTDRNGVLPAGQSAAYYDAVYLIRAAVQDEGLDAEALQAWFAEDLTFTGVQGLYSPAASTTDELSQSVVIAAVEAGAPVELARYTDRTCLIGCGD